MSLPEFNESGDLPLGVHPAAIEEILSRFGGATPQRHEVTERLERIYRLAVSTKALDRLIVFGSYVSSKPAPNDVDVVLVMRDDFKLARCEADVKALFDHQLATAEFGASVFWIRPSMLMGETLEEFIAHWQQKRDGQLRGIVEIKP